MLGNFRNIKTLSQMKNGEMGYLQIGGLLMDEEGRLWLDLEAKISSAGGGLLNPGIVRYGDNESDFELESENAYTPFIVNSKDLMDNEKYICFESLIDQKTVFQPVKVEPVKEKLAPLYDIFLNPEVLNQVLIQTSVPEILRNEKTLFSGVILYGEGGTGKTSLQRAIAKVYKSCGALAEEIHVAALSEKYIGSLGNNLDKRISMINLEAEKKGKPAFIFLDEATSLVMSSDKHNSSGADYYQEAVDVLKKYISNYPNLVFSITTNAMPDIYDDTLIREGRLTPIEIPLPGREEKKKMWDFFLTKYEVLTDLDEAQSDMLADLAENEKGSFISEFTRGYLPRKKLEEESKKAGSLSILDALAKGSCINMSRIKKSISFKIIFNDVKAALLKKGKTVSKVRLGFV